MLRGDCALACGMGRVSADDLVQRARQSASDSAVAYVDHHRLERRAQKFARACGDGKFGSILPRAREGRIRLDPCAGNARFLPDEVAVSGLVEAEFADGALKQNDAVLFCHDCKVWYCLRPQFCDPLYESTVTTTHAKTSVYVLSYFAHLVRFVADCTICRALIAWIVVSSFPRFRTGKECMKGLRSRLRGTTTRGTGLRVKGRNGVSD